MNWLVPLPVVLPLLMAAGLVAIAPICYRRIVDSASIVTAVVVTVAGAFLIHFSAQGTLVYWFGDWLPRGKAAIGISFAIDPLGAGMATFCSALMTMALIYSWEYFDAVKTYFHALMLIFLAGMTGFCLTGDLFNLFVFFELMSVVAYALTGYKVEEKQALAGSLNFAVTNSVGGFLVLIGVGLLYGRTGALNMAQVGETLAQKPAQSLMIVALTLIVCGFLIKAAVVPFHFWLADAHAVAPTPVCVLFSGVMIELGLYGSFRVYWTVFHPALSPVEPRIRLVLLVLGALTAVVGAIMCFAQRHLKRLLAFSSISHVGMMLVGAATLTSKGLAGACLYLLGHGCVKGALFMCSGLLLHRFGSVDEIELFGRGRKLVVLGPIFAICGLGLAGFPPFGTYFGKQMMEEAGKSIGQNWPTWVFLFCSALTGGAVLRVAGMVFPGWGSPIRQETSSPTAKKEKPETRMGRGKIPIVMLSATVLLTVAPLVSGFFGGMLASRIHGAAERFMDQPIYAAAVVNGKSSGSLEIKEPVRVSTHGLISGFAAGSGAVVLALTALFCDKFPEIFQRSFKFLCDPFLAALRQIHTGHIGDLIVWLVIGIVVIGAGCAFAIEGW